MFMIFSFYTFYEWENILFLSFNCNTWEKFRKLWNQTFLGYLLCVSLNFWNIFVWKMISEVKLFLFCYKIFYYNFFVCFEAKFGEKCFPSDPNSTNVHRTMQWPGERVWTCSWFNPIKEILLLKRTKIPWCCSTYI